MADAEGLNPSGPLGSCGFESRPGHLELAVGGASTVAPHERRPSWLEPRASSSPRAGRSSAPYEKKLRRVKVKVKPSTFLTATKVTFKNS